MFFKRFSNHLKAYVARRSFNTSITSQTNRLSIITNRLTDILGTENVSSTQAVRNQHGKDESYHKLTANALYSLKAPDLVVFPHSVEQVSQIAKTCTEMTTPMIPFGTGTGIEGGIICVKGGVSVDLSKMTEIIDYYPEDYAVTVQPGVTRLTLNDYVKGDGLWFPIDPGADASLCGMAATSASGTNAVKYGTMRENVINCEVILADGSIIYTAGKGRRPKKTSAGYNLTNLFVGSEGTLGFITNTTLRLYGIPDSMVSAVCHFNSIQEAVTSVQEVLQAGVPVARIELLDEVLMMAANRYSGLSYKETPTLFLEFHGSELHTKEQAETVGEILDDNGGQGFQWASDLSERNKLWKARHTALYAIMALKPGTQQISTDVCVPISHLTDIIVETKQLIVDMNLTGAILGHVGDGNFHSTILFDASDPVEKQKIQEYSSNLVKKALDVGGTCTGEHGIGLGKRDYLEQEVGRECLNVMRNIKQTLDPLGLMNPGKVLPDHITKQCDNFPLTYSSILSEDVGTGWSLGDE